MKDNYLIGTDSLWSLVLLLTDRIFLCSLSCIVADHLKFKKFSMKRKSQLQTFIKQEKNITTQVSELQESSELDRNKVSQLICTNSYQSFFFSISFVGLVVSAACLFHFSGDRLANRIDCQLTEYEIFPVKCVHMNQVQRKRKKKKRKIKDKVTAKHSLKLRKGVCYVQVTVAEQ